MRKRSIAVSIAFEVSLGAAALGMAGVHSSAPAQSADLVLCDRVAADPADPDKPADIKGVANIAESDVATAIKFCQRASTASRRALYELARAYAANRQWPQAIAAYRKAADKGSTAAMVEFGVLLAAGTGVAEDQAEARTLLARAAEAGNPRAGAELAALASAGGAQSDPVAARALLAKAVETNSADAEFQLGWMLANGIGGPRDDAAARALFERAAAQNHAEALDWAGNFAETGRGGSQDASLAKAYYEKAAALGNEDAKAALKRMECRFLIKDKRGNVVATVCF